MNDAFLEKNMYNKELTDLFSSHFLIIAHWLGNKNFHKFLFDVTQINWREIKGLSNCFIYLLSMYWTFPTKSFLLKFQPSYTYSYTLSIMESLQ